MPLLRRTGLRLGLVLLAACAGERAVERANDLSNAQANDQPNDEAGTDAPPARLEGLLMLPAVFGEGPCERFAPRPLTLYASPDSTRAVATIRTSTAWREQPEGGCEGLEVVVTPVDGSPDAPLPTREAGYEEPAAIVTGRSGAWFRVRTASEAGWLHASDAGPWHPLETLLPESLAYITDAARVPLSESPGGVASGMALTSEAPVQVTATRQSGGRLWLQLAVLEASPCETTDTPRVLRTGWVPAHAATGEPTVWFHSRGC